MSHIKIFFVKLLLYFPYCFGKELFKLCGHQIYEGNNSNIDQHNITKLK